MITVYEAIMRAAQQIETQPKSYDFYRVCVETCGTPMCVLGWIGYYYDLDTFAGKPINMVANLVLNISQIEFYARMNRLDQENPVGHAVWYSNAAVCACVLRQYADKYHKPVIVDLPAQVQAIFEEETV